MRRPELWISSQEFGDIEARLAVFLAAGEIRSAVYLTTVPPPGQSWTLSRWPGRLAVHRELADQLDPRLWMTPTSYGLIGLATFAPDKRAVGAGFNNHAAQPGRPKGHWVETADEYRASLRSSRPTLIKAPVRQITSKLPDWFGDLADERVGGATMLLSLSGVTVSTTSMVVLRNPAAFGLDPVTGTGTLPVRYQTGQVDVRARAVQARTDADYGIAITLTAPRNSEVLIDKGLVFEQLSLNGVQNLALADGGIPLVPAASPTTVALPAWCLNRELAPPAGEPVRPTPFFLRLPARTDQATVWSTVEQAPDFLRTPR
jgi:hypothetical protein